MEKLMRIKAFDALLNAITDVIGGAQDYLCELKSVRLAEWFLFWLNAAWAFAFTFFNVKGASPSFDYIFSELVWTLVFDVFLLLHFVGFYYKYPRLRYWVVFCYSMSWTIWTIIIGYARVNSPLWESCAVFTVTAIIVAVKLKEQINEFQNSNQCR